ncbi:MAG: hypothetical protein EOP21_01050 [Hyphomicrobiales bacterium]|nr:MAG: hypothetical protein EOP21_01050 [Hyphomicrobiales bacterium]
MKFCIYYTIITGSSTMESSSASEALAAIETVRLAGGTVTKILDGQGFAYKLADLAKIAAETQH